MRIEDAIFAVVDCETTGLDPEKDQVVEIAVVATSLKVPNLGMWATLVKPTVPIPPEISAVHGITDADVRTAPAANEAVDGFRDFLQVFFDGCSDAANLAAHNAEFDAPFLQAIADRFVCTKRLAMHLWPAAPNHRNQTLRYWRGLDPETYGIAPHRALGDALVTASLLLDQLQSDEFEATGITDVEQLIAYINSPIAIAKWPLGKFRQQPIAAADTSYLEWALGPRGMVDMSKDLRYTLETELRRRQEAA